MVRTLLTLAAGIGVGVGGLTAARHDEKQSVQQALGSASVVRFVQVEIG